MSRDSRMLGVGIELESSSVGLDDVLEAARAHGRVTVRTGDDVFVVERTGKGLVESARAYLLKGGPGGPAEE